MCLAKQYCHNLRFMERMKCIRHADLTKMPLICRSYSDFMAFYVKQNQFLREHFYAPNQQPIQLNHIFLFRGFPMLNSFFLDLKKCLLGFEITVFRLSIWFPQSVLFQFSRICSIFANFWPFSRFSPFSVILRFFPFFNFRINFLQFLKVVRIPSIITNAIERKRTAEEWF